MGMSEARGPDLERLAADEARACLGERPIGSELALGPSSQLSKVLEFLVPQILRREHPEWRRESLDGFEFSSSIKTGETSAVLTGICILISDQAVTPCTFDIELGDTRPFRSFRVRLGEPGTGPLGISGPPWGSPAAARLLLNLDSRLERIPWVYDIQTG
jgi:hypothetical protein